MEVFRRAVFRWAEEGSVEVEMGMFRYVGGGGQCVGKLIVLEDYIPHPLQVKINFKGPPPPPSGPPSGPPSLPPPSGPPSPQLAVSLDSQANTLCNLLQKRLDPVKKKKKKMHMKTCENKHTIAHSKTKQKEQMQTQHNHENKHTMCMKKPAHSAHNYVCIICSHSIHTL